MKTKTQYHHGDLRSGLLEAAKQLLKDQGIDSISLRKLGDVVGVTRTAPYHHFKNKNELLFAVAADGFEKWLNEVQSIEMYQDDSVSKDELFRRFTRNYIHFARENPALYDLMFGRPLWQGNYNTNSLKEVAYPVFEYLRDLVKNWQDNGILPFEEDNLRLTQVVWSTLHGIARLLNDGIYITKGPDDKTANQVEEMCDCATRIFLGLSK